jgi:Uma2 family endonuclease
MVLSMPTPAEAAAPTSERASGAAEKRFVLWDVPWSAYVTLRDAVDHPGLRMTYLEGALELMSPSGLHEESKHILGRLVVVWAEHDDVDLRGFASTTFRRRKKKRGLEPDECYTIGPMDPEGVPQLAIEVIVASPLLDKLAVYAGLAIPEVWTWRDADRRVVVHVLRGGRYREAPGSALLSGIDLAQLATFVRPGESHNALARAYRKALAER